MYFEQALKKAIEGGYKTLRKSWGRDSDPVESHLDFALNDHDAPPFAFYLLDPFFWQCLGVSLGWLEKDKETDHLIKLSGGVEITPKMTEWARQMHRYIDHLIDGKDPELFFKKLTETK